MPLKSYKEQFYEHLPFYLSIGMTADEYWHGDCTLVKYYRKAEELRIKKKNEELWLQGLYIYDALCAVSPILHAFAKSGTKAEPYLSEPVPLTQKEFEEAQRRKKQRQMEQMLAYMKTWSEGVNERMNNIEAEDK